MIKEGNVIIISDAEVNDRSKFGLKSVSECAKALWFTGCDNCEYAAKCSAGLTGDYLIIPWEELYYGHD